MHHWISLHPNSSHVSYIYSNDTTMIVLGTSFEERMSQLRQLEIEAEHIRQEVLVHRY